MFEVFKNIILIFFVDIESVSVKKMIKINFFIEVFLI